MAAMTRQVIHQDPLTHPAVCELLGLVYDFSQLLRPLWAYFNWQLQHFDVNKSNCVEIHLVTFTKTFSFCSGTCHGLLIFYFKVSYFNKSSVRPLGMLMNCGCKAGRNDSTFARLMRFSSLRSNCRFATLRSRRICCSAR